MNIFWTPEQITNLYYHIKIYFSMFYWIIYLICKLNIPFYLGLTFLGKILHLKNISIILQNNARIQIHILNIKELRCFILIVKFRFENLASNNLSKTPRNLFRCSNYTFCRPPFICLSGQMILSQF